MSSALKDMEAPNKSFPRELLLIITILLKPSTELVKYQKVLPNLNLIFDTRQVQWNCNPKPSVGVLQVSNLVRVWNSNFDFLSVSYISLSSVRELPWPVCMCDCRVERCNNLVQPYASQVTDDQCKLLSLRHMNHFRSRNTYFCLVQEVFVLPAYSIHSL